MGYKYKKATFDPNWVDVKEKLPNENDKVIVFSERYKMQFIAEFRTGVFIFGGARYRIDEVSHWQPLLLPPQSVVEQNEC